MPAELAASPDTVHDLVGVGFGPANLALAVAISEHNEKAGRQRALRAVFLERKAEFGWHTGMLIDGATMQVCFMKDLVTLRNPASRFSFLSYLHDKRRLVDFINHKTLFPSRLEFHDYLEWTAAKLPIEVRYGSEVVQVRSVPGTGPIEQLDLIVRDADEPSETRVYRTRNLVLGTGLVPRLPDGVASAARIWHSSEFLDRLSGAPERNYRRFVVVGAGQSAAEIVAHLHERFRDVEIYAVFTRYGYSPADDSPFANGVFDPDVVDVFYRASPAAKDSFYNYHANTNYSVVDVGLIEDLYRRYYQERVSGKRRLHFANMSRVAELRPGTDSVGVDIEYLPNGRRTRMDADAVIYATGYRPMEPAGLLGGLAGLCKLDGEGRLRVERDYRVATTTDVRSGIYLQGGTEQTHGLSASLLSNVAVRAGEIMASVLSGTRSGSDVRS
jgi:L-ornithine N5-monooxygenase